MIAYVDKLPTVKAHNGGFIIKATSGETPVQMILIKRGQSAVMEVLSEEQGAEVRSLALGGQMRRPA